MFEYCHRSAEFRASGNEGQTDGRTLEGYAAVFDTDTEINSWEGQFVERIAKGAFKKTLNERKPIMQYDHGRDTRVGSVPIGVYNEIREDDHGLFVSGRVFDNNVVEPVRQAIEAQAISGMSFKFRVTRDEWRDGSGKLLRGNEIGNLLFDPGSRGPLQRTIKEVSLFEAGPVASPAYSQTSVGVRSMADMTEADRQALAAEYRRTMMVEEVDELCQREGCDCSNGPHPQELRLADWLDAETRWNADVSAWLEAEATHKTSSETDAARKGTSVGETPEKDAAHKGTSNRDSQHTPERNAPVKKEKVMTLEELRGRLAEIDARFEELGEESRDSELPEAEQKEWDDLTAERGRVEASIARIEERKARMAELGKDARHTEGGSDRGSRTRGQRRTPDNIYDVNEIRNSSHGQDDFRRSLRDNAMRAIEAAQFPVRDKEAARERAEEMLGKDNRHGDLAKMYLLTGSEDYERAFGKMVLAGSPNVLTPDEFALIHEARAQAVSVDSSGGYAVPFQLDPTVMLQNAGTINPLRQIARNIQIVGKEWDGVTSAGISVTRGTEGSTASDNSFTLGQKTVRVNRVQGFVPFSIEIEQDWGALRSEITTLLVDAKEREEATSFTLGDGTGVNANGVVTTLSGNTVTTASVASFAAADVYSMESALAPRYRSNARFLANKAVYNLVRQFDTYGGAQLWERIGAGMPGELLGYPAHEVFDMVSTLTTGSKIMLFGDFSNFAIVDKIGMQVELVPMLFDQANGNRPTGQRGIYAIWRNNSKILNDAAFKLLVTR